MRSRTAIASIVALVTALVAPTGVALAEDPPAPAGPVVTADGGAKDVVESPTGSYIVVMKQDPLAASVPATELATPEAVAQGDALEAAHAEVLAEADVATDAKVHDYTNSLNGFSAVVSHDKAIEMAADPTVALVLPDELRQVTQAAAGNRADGTEQDDLGNFLGLTDRAEAWRSGITGEKVVVGVIDTGIWPEHPSFADDGSYPAPDQPLDSTERPACNFGNTAHNPDDKPFSCNNKLIGAREMLDTYRAVSGLTDDEFDSARDDEGHGTHTASTAAGNANVQADIFGRKIAVISGIAPRAQLVAYKALGSGGGYTSDLVAAIDQAVADGVDVINYSLGGGASQATGDAIALLFAADAGVFAAVSAGNDGPGAETIGGPADVPWVTAVGANTMSRFFEGTVQLDGGPTVSGASVTQGTGKLPLVDAEAAPVTGKTGAESELCLAGTLDPAKVTGKIVLCKRGGNGRVAKSAEVLAAGGAGMILYNATDTDDLNTDNFFVPTVHLNFSEGVKVKFYIQNHRDPAATIQTGKVTSLPYAPSMASFSSRGPNPTAADIIKPDITAPGVQILAGMTPDPAPGPDASPSGQLFQAIAGTSMSSPVVAGVYALIKQVHPDWSPAAAKSAIMTTADTKVKDNDRKTQAGPFAMGAGMVDPGKPGTNGSAFRPGLVYDIGFNDYLGYLCDVEPEVVGASTCAALTGLGVPTDATALNLPSIGISSLAGSQTVKRTVTSVADRKQTWKGKATAPAGYSVTVSPNQLTLEPGQSATFEVTITNTGKGTVGEWATGDLTWKTGNYAVRSPIAVKGVTISVPDEVSGTGTSGSTAFDVKFGYTGPYTAAAHGLVAPIDTTGDIGQDADQTYTVGEQGPGVDEIPVTLTGIAHARWSLVIPGDDDIDLYLVKDGKVVAASTNGGTDEVIDVSLPADGVYTLVVFGWSVPSEPLSYTLQNWNVSATPGGSLVIDSAPTAAAIGTTGQVKVSWSGLTEGVSYLGAVSHTGATGLVGLTLVDVTG